jgi:hypothetical protein
MLDALYNVSLIVLAFVWDLALGAHLNIRDAQGFLYIEPSSKREVL